MLPLAQIMEHYNISYHDDKQLYIAVWPYDCSPLQLLSAWLNDTKNHQPVVDSNLNFKSLMKTFTKSA